MKLAGNAPRVIKSIDLKCTEMMAWLYCPIKLKASKRTVFPHNLAQFARLLAAVQYDIYATRGEKSWTSSYIYLTAKRLWVSPENPGNREGWHCDGYGTSDLNYIWSDRNPTLFWEPPTEQRFSDDHTQSMREMTELAEAHPHYIRTYPDSTLLRLDETVIHNVAPCETAGWRTFVKFSVSDQRYLLEGNSINHELAPDWKYVPRAVDRNCPLAPLKVGDGHYDMIREHCERHGYWGTTARDVANA